MSAGGQQRSQIDLAVEIPKSYRHHQSTEKERDYGRKAGLEYQISGKFEHNFLDHDRRNASARISFQNRTHRISF